MDPREITESPRRKASGGLISVIRGLAGSSFFPFSFNFCFNDSN